MKSRDALAIVSFVEACARVNQTGRTYEQLEKDFLAVVDDERYPVPPPRIMATITKEELDALRELQRRVAAYRDASKSYITPGPNSPLQAIFNQLARLESMP